MKRTFKFLAPAALAAILVFPGCQREEAVTDGVKSVNIPLSFEGINGPETRVDIDGTSGVGTWTEGDQIAIWVSGPGANFYQYRTVESIGVNTVPEDDKSVGKVLVSLSAGQNRANFAIYPASASVEDHHTADDLYITYPSEYDYFKDGKMTVAQAENYSPTPMVAINNPVTNLDDPSVPAPPLEFYHVGGVLRLTVHNVPQTAEILRFTFPEEMKFTGTFKVTNGGTANATLTPVGDDHSNVVTVKIPVPEAAQSDLTINIPLPCGDYTAASRNYKVEAISRMPFMETVDAVNWKEILRAQGKKADTPDLYTLGTMAGMYMVRGYLRTEVPGNISAANLRIDEGDQMSILSVAGQGSASGGVARTYYFSYSELARIMTGESTLQSFTESTLDIDGVSYRVPSMLEWNALVNDRPGSTVNNTGNRLTAKVRVRLAGSNHDSFNYYVGYVDGLILFPDGGVFDCPSITNYSKVAAFSANTLTFGDYRSLTDSPYGCVFLPCAGYMNGSDWRSVAFDGLYWSSTLNSGSLAYGLTFNAGSVDPSYIRSTSYYYPVRLLREY